MFTIIVPYLKSASKFVTVSSEAATGGILWQACNFIKKETLAEVFSCEFCEISKNTFSYTTPPVAASVS